MSGAGKESAPRRETGGARGDLEGDRRQLGHGGKVPETGDGRDHEHLLPDPDAAVAFLEAWRPGGPWVLTAIEVDPLKGGSPIRALRAKGLGMDRIARELRCGKGLSQRVCTEFDREQRGAADADQEA